MAESPVCVSHVPCGATIRYLFIAAHRDGAVQSPRSRSPTHIEATGLGCAMPHHLSTLYRTYVFWAKKKSPVERFLSYWVGGKEFLPACLPAKRDWDGSGSALLLRQEKQSKTFFNSF